jgi:hypothetical protein
VANEVNAVDTVDEFVSSMSVVSHMLTTYNTRKEGKTYVQNTFTTLFKDLLTVNEDFGGTMNQKGPNLPLLTKVWHRKLASCDFIVFVISLC